MIKARIAQEHPLLIFDDVPKTGEADETLGLRSLFERGRTVQWNELPARFWAVTGFRLEDEKMFREFGRLRNGVQHFGPPPAENAIDALEFIFKVIDPFINDMWGLFAVEYNEDEEGHIYLPPTLIAREIPFRMPPGMASLLDEWNVDWAAVSPEYHKELRRRVAVVDKVR